MPMQEYENVKGFTFVQSTEPTNMSDFDTWYNTSNNKVYMYASGKWSIYVNSRYYAGANYGYSLGGNENTVTHHYSIIDRITFPFDSGTATHVGNLSGTREYNSGCNSSNYGYSLGGDEESGTNARTIIDRITFPFDSGTATHVGNLSSTRYLNAGCNSSNYGYSLAGNDFGYYSSIDRITFPFDSGTATHVGNLNGSKYAGAGCNSSNYGYSLGGTYSVSYSQIDRITFPFDSGTATHVGNMSSTRHHNAACNSSNYGYSLGGTDSGNQSQIDRIIFPFDSGTATHVGNLSDRKNLSAGCNSSNYGYSLGGNDSGNRTSIDRITFPFDSGTSTHVGNLSDTRYSNAACDGTDFVTLFN